MARKETVREFINRRSHGAFITFEFDVDQVSETVFKQYRCVSVKDFLEEYGRRSSYILDDYVVVDTKSSYLSQSQGQTIWMTLQKKSEYVETLKPVELTPFEVEDIVHKLDHIKETLLADTSFANEPDNSQAVKEINAIIAKLEEE